MFVSLATWFSTCGTVEGKDRGPGTVCRPSLPLMAQLHVHVHQ